MILIGAGGHGKVVLDAALLAGVEVETVLDDAPGCAEMFGVPVRRRDGEDAEIQQGQEFLVSIGDDTTRKRVFEEMVGCGAVPVNVVHPKAWVSPRAELGGGIFAAAMVVVNPGARIGDNCILNTACSVDHDCEIGRHVHLCPGVRLAGQVWVGELTMVGTGAVVLPGVRIGARCIIGAGAVVTKDVTEGSVVAGVPGRVVGRSKV